MFKFIKKYPRSTVIASVFVLCVLGVPIVMGLGDYAKTWFWWTFWPVLAVILVIVLIALRAWIHGNNE